MGKTAAIPKPLSAFSPLSARLGDSGIPEIRARGLAEELCPYSEAETCADCRQSGNAMMTRVVESTSFRRSHFPGIGLK